MPNDCIQKMVKIFTDSEPFQKVILIKYHSACKDKHFSRHESTVCRLFRFSSKTGGNRPSAYCIRYRFSALGPELSPRRVAIRVVFHQNSTVVEHRSPINKGLPTRKKKKTHHLRPKTPPTALRSRGNCPPKSSGICTDFLLVSISPLCRWPSRAERPYPRLWPAIGHEKARAFCPGQTLSP